MKKWACAEMLILRQCAGTMTVGSIGRLIGRSKGGGQNESAAQNRWKNHLRTKGD